MDTTGRSLPQDAIDWISRLAQVMGKRRNDSLAEPLWDQVRMFIATYHLPCRLVGNALGFSLEIFNHSTFPGESPNSLLLIDYSRIPGMGRKGSDQPAALDQLSVLTHSPENLQLLEYYNLEQNPDPQSYRY